MNERLVHIKLRDCGKHDAIERISNQGGGFFPANVLRLLGVPNHQKQPAGTDKKNHMNPLILQLKKLTPLCLTVFALGCLALLPKARAVSPPPDGGYPGGNTAEGDNALLSLTTGTFNTAIGGSALYSDTSGGSNTALGARALRNNTTGESNTALGNMALFFNSGSTNTAIGDSALLNNTSGFGNVATGFQALLRNRNGHGNVANGSLALQNNTTGSTNTAVGALALALNNADDNTAVGAAALFGNTTGSGNTAVGNTALTLNTDGFDNTAVGDGALSENSEGFGNTAVGAEALGELSGTETEGNFNTAVGDEALASSSTGEGNVAVGQAAGKFVSTGTFNTFVGTGAGIGVTTASSVICIGDEGRNVSHSCFIGNIFGQTSGGVPVLINSFGRLGTLTSSARYKDEIKPIGKSSEALFALKPVTFHYKKEIDPAGTPQFGLVAEEVEKVNPHLVVRDEEGKPYSVRYEQVNAMLLNEFLKEHRTAQEQQKEIDALKAELKEQKALIQKVSDRVQLNRPAPQMAVNNNQ